MQNFKNGDLVYCYGSTEKFIFYNYVDDDTLSRVPEYSEVQSGDLSFRFLTRSLCHATVKNHIAIKDIFPDLELDKPNLTGSDLARDILSKRTLDYIYAFVSNESDEEAIRFNRVRSITFKQSETTSYFLTPDNIHWAYAVPVEINIFKPKGDN